MGAVDDIKTATMDSIDALRSLSVGQIDWDYATISKMLVGMIGQEIADKGYRLHATDSELQVYLQDSTFFQIRFHEMTGCEAVMVDFIKNRILRGYVVIGFGCEYINPINV